MKIKNNKLSLLFSIILFGSIWGILEASLGSLLHLQFFRGMGVFASTSVIMISIAYVLLSIFYKKTDKLWTIPLVGVVAGAIKLTSAFGLGFLDIVYKPAIYIVVESLAMFGALAITRPSKVLSFKNLAGFAIGYTLYQLTYLSATTIFEKPNYFVDNAFKYLVTCNALANAYLLVGGFAAYGVKLLNTKHNEQVKNSLIKFIESPIAAMCFVTIAVAVTITLSIL